MRHHRRDRRQPSAPSKEIRAGQGTTDTPSPSKPPTSQPRPLREHPPCLTFSPEAWLKLQFFCHRGDCEVGGFGVTAPDDPLYVQDFVTVRQRVSWAGVEFEDDAVADLFDRMVDSGVPPERFARVWLHTHPGESAEPSCTDEQTFASAFGGCDWAVMFILGRTGRTFARLSFSAGPGGSLALPVAIDWSAWPALVGKQPVGGCNEVPNWPIRLAAWAEEFDAHIRPCGDPVLFDSRMLPADLWDEGDWASGLELGLGRGAEMPSAPGPDDLAVGLPAIAALEALMDVEPAGIGDAAATNREVG